MASKEAAPSKEMDSRPRKYCGMAKRTFLVVIVVTALVIIGAIIGGVVGGLKARDSHRDKDKDKDKSGQDSGEAEDDHTVRAPVLNSTLRSFQRSFASASLAEVGWQNIQLFYSDLNSTDILHRRLTHRDNGTQEKLDLDIEPNWGSPLAATVLNTTGHDPISIQLFYLTTTDKDKKAEIVQATLECAANSTSACKVESNSRVKAGLDKDIYPDSKLAVVSSTRKHVYCQADDYSIYRLQEEEDDEDEDEDSAQGGWEAQQLATGAIPGAYFTAFPGNDTELKLLYVANTTRKLMQSNYTEKNGPDSSVYYNGTRLNDGFWLNTTITAIRTDEAPLYRVFHASTGGGKIGQLTQEYDDEQGQWNYSTDTTELDGGFGAVVWHKQRRMYYVDGHGKLMVTGRDEDRPFGAQDLGPEEVK